MFNEELEINLYAMLLRHGMSEGSDLMDQECERYVEDVNRDTVTGAMEWEQ